MKIENAEKYRENVIQLLLSAKLPVEDLSIELSGFFVALTNKKVVGVAGLEIYGDCGLLRSIAVEHEFRKQNIANNLLVKVESQAVLNNLKTIYLLTETAAGYFQGKGYETIMRVDVPLEVQASSEFSHVCPLSAIVMKKDLK